MKIVIRKANVELDVDFNKLPQASQDYIIAYGLTQCLNDAHASIDASDTDAVTVKVSDRLQRLIDGNPPSMGSRADELTAEARVILTNLLRATNMKAIDAKAAAKDIEEGIKLLLDRKKLPATPANVKAAMTTIMSQAQSVVDIRNAKLDI